jgi:hypothetical protein
MYPGRSNSTEAGIDQTIGTYKLSPEPLHWNESLRTQWQTKTHFYWSSFSLFHAATRFAPEILERYHYCGPGSTYKLIREALPATSTLQACLSHENWLEWMAQSL